MLVIKQMIFSSTPWEVNTPGTRLNRKFSFNCPPPWSLPALTRGSHKLRLLVMATLVLHNVVNLTIDSTTFFVHILFKVCIVLISFVMHLVFMIRFCKLRLMHFYRYLVYIHIRNLFSLVYISSNVNIPLLLNLPNKRWNQHYLSPYFFSAKLCIMHFHLPVSPSDMYPFTT